MAVTAGIRRPSLSRTQRRAVVSFLFVVPALVLFLTFLAIPLVYSAGISLFRWTGMSEATFMGLENYRRLLTDNVFWLSMKATVLYALMVIPVTTLASLVAAIFVNQGLRGTNVFKSLIFIPVITSSVVIAVVWSFIYQGGDVGLLNAVLRFVGLPGHVWMGDMLTALPAIAVIGVWHRFGWFSVLFLAGLQDIPIEQREAAEIDGASQWQVFWHVTLPLLRPTIALVMVLGAIQSFQVFDVVFIMTEGGPYYSTHVLGYYIWTEAFRGLRMGYASAMSYILFGSIMIITLIQLRILRPAT